MITPDIQRLFSDRFTGRLELESGYARSTEIVSRASRRESNASDVDDPAVRPGSSFTNDRIPGMGAFTEEALRQEVWGMDANSFGVPPTLFVSQTGVKRFQDTFIVKE